MCNLRMSDIKQEGAALLITIRPCKTDKGRKFAVIDSNIPYVQLFNKYLSLRPENVETDRVFLKYCNGRCFRQVVGINTFGKCPYQVAHFLNLENAARYTGHSFRRTSATIMANSGMTIDEMKRQVGWKSSAVAASYIEDSTTNKVEVSRRIATLVNESEPEMLPCASTLPTNGMGNNFQILSENNELKKAGIEISNNTKCTINIYLK